MSAKEIIEKLNRENPAKNTYMTDHAMMAWEYLEEPINENESDSASVPNSPQKNLAEEEEANDEFSESSSPTDYDHLEQERIQRQ